MKLTLTPAEKAQISSALLIHPDLKALAARGRLRVLSVVPHLPVKEEAPRPPNLARVVLFNYGEGKAYRALYDPAANRVVALEPLAGRPQPSADEIREAFQLVKADPAHAKLVAGGDVLEGGFAVDGPPGSPAQHRFVQVQVLSRDRASFVRIVTVDLTAGKIAASVH